MRQYDTDSEETPPKPTPRVYHWHEAFLALVMQPRLETFQHLLQDPQANAQRAYLWMLLPQILSNVALLSLVAPSLGMDWLSLILIGALVGGIWGIMRFIISGWIIQRVAVFFGGDATAYGAFHYARATYMPIMVIAYAFVSLLTGQQSTSGQYLLAGLLLIELVLTGMALRAVNDIPWRQVFLVLMTWYLLSSIAGLGFSSLR